MNALMHLEAQGRRVGVISHVKEMTDAIPVKINVVKRRGGASRIVIPGADPVTVSPVTDFDPSAKEKVSTGSSARESKLAKIEAEILRILERERQNGNGRVSVVALRREIDCDSRDLKSAQSRLDGQITVVGRSLILAESSST